MRFHHFAVEVKDLETSIAFYQTYLGLCVEEQLQFNKETIVFLAKDDFKIELISGGLGAVSQRVHLCLEVDNLQEIIRKFNNNGISALEGPYSLNNGWETVFYEGPDNEVIEFLQIGDKLDC